MVNSDVNVQMDVIAINRIPIVSTMLEVVCRTTGMGFAAIARVTDEKWVACAVRDEINFGLKPGGELVLETTICNEIRQHRRAVVIDHVAEDKVFNRHPTPEMYGFQSYISIPIILKNGDFFGTLCAIDPKPAAVNNAKTIGMFQLFTELISFHLSTMEELALAEATLLEERKTAEMREQFIAVLGHDLRNPITAISNSAKLLQQMPLEQTGIRLANVINNSSHRIVGLIDNVLDFARGRMGSGMMLNKKLIEVPANLLNQVVNEHRMVYPESVIETNFTFKDPVYCDPSRISQLFSNLLTNAIIYGQPNTPVQVEAGNEQGEFTLSVTNKGNPISADTLSRIFKPFSRGDMKSGKNGLGLGLFISSEIAAAHNGILEVNSTNEQTTFTLRIPSQNAL